MILIVSFPNNNHVEQVRKHLTVPSVVVDTGWFPSLLGLTVQLGNQVERLKFSLPDGGQVDLTEVGAVWYRRLRPYKMHDDLSEETSRLFAWSESNEALLGLWYSLNCFWMNRPMADEVAQRKIRQLQVARQVGLSIPETLITNDPTIAREFVQLCGPGNVIRKAFRNIPQAPRETIIVRDEELSLMDSVKYAPVIFQRYVPADLDLRVTVVEDEIFAAAIYSQPEYKTDYRRGLTGAKVKPYELPPDVAESLFRLMKVFDINYGAIDLRLTPEGEFIFLEVNPAGEFLFISERTNQPIPAAIAASLERHDRAARGKLI